MPATRNVHLVGSVRLPHEPDDPLASPLSPREIFQALCAALPGRLQRIPDGESGERHHFVNWQIRVFEPCPWLLNDHERSVRSVIVPDNAERLDIKLAAPGYDEYAFRAFESFENLQDQGVIEPGARFQVSIPTPIQPICRYVRPEFRSRVEPIYEVLLRKSIETIQAHIPPGKLAFQFDCAMEFAMLESVPGPGGAFNPWFNMSPQTLVDRIEHIASAVHDDAKLGFHLCYGDLQHRHFIEPKDSTRLVVMANLIAEKIPHTVDFFHIPVPKQRTDDGYFAPLKDLRLSSQTEIVLGLVHAHDLDGTLQRIATARKVILHFGVATECGWGRTPVRDIDSILQILRRVSAPEEIGTQESLIQK